LAARRLCFDCLLIALLALLACFFLSCWAGRLLCSALLSMLLLALLASRLAHKYNASTIQK
jgi:hypothetical protein